MHVVPRGGRVGVTAISVAATARRRPWRCASVGREGATLDPDLELEIAQGDVVALTGYIDVPVEATRRFGTEVTAPMGVHLIEEAVAEALPAPPTATGSCSTRWLAASRGSGTP